MHPNSFSSVYGTVLGQQEQPRQDKNLVYWPKQPGKVPFNFVLFESPFAMVSRGHLSLIFLISADGKLGFYSEKKIM
jgi:hypothetical protein